MISFLLSIVALIAGYFIYGSIVDKIFGSNTNNSTPANRINDGVDYVPLPWYKIFMIQTLNIAGLGPIIGAIMGGLYGPAAFLWIVLGSIFAGAVHDYFSGMLSLRHDGESISEVVGIYLGNFMRQFMRVFSVVLLLFVGVVFILGPSKLLANMHFGGVFDQSWIWLLIILGYYFLATIIPIDKVIGRIYPVFGFVLLIMAVGIGGVLIFTNAAIPEVTFKNFHPKGLPIWPLMFITIACGALSGFHATQSPVMARCLKDERHGRRVFYGAMISEGAIALVWAAASMSFFGGIDGLGATVANGGWAVVVHKVANGLMGPVGGFLAILGVIACPITSGDTAFRSARLTIADAMDFKQKPIKNRLMVAVPLFAIAIAITYLPWQVIWRYFAFSNQTLATIVLWASAMFLAVNHKFHWIATIPATFMTAVCTTYILIAPEGFKLSTSVAYPIGIIVALFAVTSFVAYLFPKGRSSFAAETE